MPSEDSDQPDSVIRVFACAQWEAVRVKVFADKTSHFVASWYRPPSNTSGEFQLFREQLDCIRTHYKGNKKSYNILKRDNGLCFRIRIRIVTSML